MPILTPTRPGRLFAAAATLVAAPRLVLAFLVGDAVEVPASVRIALLSISSVATAIALTGGAAYLAHAIAVARTGRRLLTALWIAILVCSSALMAPLIAAGLPRSPLASVLDSPAHRWIWAVCAVLAVDLVAAGAMRADAEQRRDAERSAADHERAIAELLRQRDTARTEALHAQQALAHAAQRPQPAPQRTMRRTQSVSAEAERTTASAHRCACGRPFDSQPALAAHLRWCAAARPSLAPPSLQALGGDEPAGSGPRPVDSAPSSARRRTPDDRRPAAPVV
jgi:hypothetical protein